MTVKGFQTLLIDDISLPDPLRGNVVAIGNFDGFHLGHRTVVNETLAIAKTRNCPAILLTFDPNPRTWFNPDNPVYLLTPPELKTAMAEKSGFSLMAVHSFNDAFASLSVDDFIKKILVEKLGAAHVVAGHNFHFGAKRSGSPNHMMEAGEKYGFGVSVMQARHDANGNEISSSRIRNYLTEGKLDLANELLGYSYRIDGIIIEGQKLGRKLGFPTANIALSRNVGLKRGIYAAKAIRANGNVHDGVASYGRRPTFDNGRELFETFLFDFDGNLYGEKLTVVLFCWLRNEVKFDSVDDLVAQMKIDEKNARKFLRALPSDYSLAIP